MSAIEAYLIIKKGELFEKGSIVTLQAGKLSIGRSWEDNGPDIPFVSPYVSKKHAEIEVGHASAFLTDVESKHGTYVNGDSIGCNAPHHLQDGDEVHLAHGAVMLLFFYAGQSNIGETRDLSGELPLPIRNEESSEDFVICEERRQVHVDGKPIQVTGKDMQLLLLLYKYRQKAVAYQEIKSAVWPERILVEGIPDVGNEEIAILIHRVRRKIGRFGNRIVSLPKYGYMMDMS